MPYQNEYAQYKPLQRLAGSERIHELLGDYEVQKLSDLAVSAIKPIAIEDLDDSDWQPDYILAMDGSHLEVAVQNGYPGAEASYLTVASVLIDVAKMRKLDSERPIDPREFRTLEQAEAIDCALPGCNIIYKGEISAKSSLRRAIYEIFKTYSPVSDDESLLETYEVLLQRKPQEDRGNRPVCPYEDCPTDARYRRGRDQYHCDCHLKRNWYSTDALRIHERMNPAGSNGAIFSEIMQVLERILLVNILRIWEKRKLLSVLKRVAIIIDGPLAVFGQPAWLSHAIYEELSRINGVARKDNGQDLLLLGVEKSGNFVDHIEQLDRNENNVVDQLPNGSVLLFDDDYIKKHIIFSESKRSYGFATYFGRKFAYKTKSGSKIVASLPFLDEDHRDLTTAHPDQFPRLSDTLHMIDHLVSTRYQNAVTPIVSAHAEASIPLHIGTKVLENLAKEIIKDQKE